MRRVAAGFPAALLLGAVLVSPLLRAQEAPPSDPLEEAFLASIEAHGQSHASGGRPELGPVIIGNPTRAVVTLRIGLSWSYTSMGTYSEFATVQHPFAQISNSVGNAHVIDRSTNKLVDVMQAGNVYDVR